jgi:hypothetical protein
MTPDMILKVAAIFLTNLGIGITLSLAINKDTFASPLRWAVTILSVLTFLTVLFFWMSLLSIWYIMGIIALNGSTFAFIYNTVKERDIGGINYGQLTIEYFNRLDKQISFILNGISSKNDKLELRQAVGVALSFSIRTIAHLLALDVKHDSHFSIYHAAHGTFTVVASDGIPQDRIQIIQRNFRYDEKPFGLAGYSAHDCKIISMRDVSDTKDPNFDKWAPTTPNAPRDGSIICIPLIRGLKGDGELEPIGVISLTSVKKGAFESAPVRSLLNRFVVKVEILLYCLEMLE